MTAQRGIAYEVRALSAAGGQLKSVLNVMSSRTPHSCRLLFFHGEVFLPGKLRKTCPHQIAAHIGEVDVAAIEIAGFVAGTAKGAGYAGQMARLGGHLHDRHGGERRIAAPGTQRTAVGAPCVAVAVGKVDSLAHQAVQVGRYIGVAAHFGEHAAAALQKDDNDVGPASGEQGVSITVRGIVVVFFIRVALSASSIKW